MTGERELPRDDPPVLPCTRTEAVDAMPLAVVASSTGESPTVCDYPENLRNRSELLTTLTELNAMAAAATVGTSIPEAARGIPTTLYTKAQKRFCLIVVRTREESRMARDMP